MNAPTGLLPIPTAPAGRFAAAAHRAPAVRWAAVFLALIGPAASAEEALVQAVRVGDAAQWRALLAGQPDVAARDAQGNTALHFAALNHDVEAVRALLAAGAEADARNTAKATPLLYGAGHAEIARLLLAAGADVNAAAESKRTPLVVAVAQPSSHEAVRVLLDAGADPRAATRPGAATMLVRAIDGGDSRTIALLLERGTEFNPTKGYAPLVHAAWLGDTSTVRALLERGVNVNHNSGFAGHALNFALYADQREVARLLIERGADLKLRSPEGHGSPPPVLAAYNQDGDPALVRQLVAAGASVNDANDEGATALSFALKTGAHTPLVAYLREKGATAPTAGRTKNWPDRPVPAGATERAALIRERVRPALGLLQRSSAAFLENAFVRQQNCVSCHQQDLPVVAFEAARARGLAPDDLEVGRALAGRLAMLAPTAEDGRQVTEPVPDAAVSVGYGLFAFRAARYAPDDFTDGVVHYLLRAQKPGGQWNSYDRRPPMEDGPLIGTAWAALAVRDYAPAGLRREAAESQARSARWLAAQQPVNHNEAVFQLLGRHWSGEPAARLGSEVDRLVRTQQPDGGWSQLPGRESDAWATGSALFALHDSGAMRADHPVYQRGVEFLLRTQFEDGSWWVRSRTWPFQPHFNGQFPHGKDQWISAGATAWAVLALLATLEPVAGPGPGAAELIAAFRNSAAAMPRVRPAGAPPSAATVDFIRDIAPILERSCTGCHGGEKPRGGFSMASRETLLKGGHSGEAPIIPGVADESLLLGYVSDHVEDLEMPPLDRRDEYPPLSPAEVAALRAWIDAGAPWAAAER